LAELDSLPQISCFHTWDDSEIWKAKEPLETHVKLEKLAPRWPATKRHLKASRVTIPSPEK